MDMFNRLLNGNIPVFIDALKMGPYLKTGLVQK